MPVMVPGTQTGFNETEYQLKFERATYQRQKFIPTIDQGDRPLTSQVIRKKARISGTALSSTDTGTGLTYSRLDDTPVTITPSGNYVAVAWSKNLSSQIRNNMDSESGDDILDALAELNEQTALAAVPALTNIISQADMDASMLRRAVGRLQTNTNGVAGPGEPGSPTIYGIVTTKQYPNLVSIPEVNRADMRGDSENPYIKGVWVKGFGFMLMLTTVAANDANGDHNCLYIPEAFVISWNTKSNVEFQTVELQRRAIGFSNMGTGVKNNNRAISMRTTASAL